MNYREFLNNRTYPIVMFHAVKSNGTVIADHADTKEREFGDMPVIAIARQRVYFEEYGESVPCEIVVLGEPLRNDDEEVKKFFKDLK